MRGKVIDIKEKNGAVTFKIKVQPRAAKSEIVGVHGDAVKVRIASPPIDGKANEEVKKFFANLLGVPTGAVEIVAGLSSRDKLLRLHRVERERVLAAITLRDVT